MLPLVCSHGLRGKVCFETTRKVSEVTQIARDGSCRDPRDPGSNGCGHVCVTPLRLRTDQVELHFVMVYRCFAGQRQQRPKPSSSLLRCRGNPAYLMSFVVPAAALGIPLKDADIAEIANVVPPPASKSELRSLLPASSCVMQTTRCMNFKRVAPHCQGVC